MQLEVQHLSYQTDNQHLLSDIDFSSAAHNRTAVLGANGAGKTLLLRLCHGLIDPSAGTIMWNHQPVQQLFSRITMVFQHPIVLTRSVRKNIEHALYLKGIPKDARCERALAALARVGMSRYAEHHAQHLSGGQRQRLAIARAWATQPSVILLDEPTAGIDMESLAQIEDLIRSLADEGVKVILTSHNPAQVKRLCDEVIFLDQGNLVCHVATSDFFSQIDDPRVRLFIDSQSL